MYKSAVAVASIGKSPTVFSTHKDPRVHFFAETRQHKSRRTIELSQRVTKFRLQGNQNILFPHMAFFLTNIILSFVNCLYPSVACPDWRSPCLGEQFTMGLFF